MSHQCNCLVYVTENYAHWALQRFFTMDYKEVIQRNLVLFLLFYSYIVLQIDVMILYLFACVHQLAHRMIYTLDYSTFR